VDAVEAHGAYLGGAGGGSRRGRDSRRSAIHHLLQLGVGSLGGWGLRVEDARIAPAAFDDAPCFAAILAWTARNPGHADDAEAGAREIARVLRPAGCGPRA
jgi:hypothetical protein